MRPAVPAALAALTVLTPLGAGAAQVCEANEATLVYHCKIAGSTRAVTACEMRGKRFFYAYGRPGQAFELVLHRNQSELLYRPWNGIGRAFWATLSFFNKGYRYEFAWSVEKTRSGDEKAMEGVLMVYEPGADEPVSTKTCRPGTVRIGLTFHETRFPTPPQK